MDCLDDNTIIEFLDGLLGATDSARVEEHLDACSDCRTQVSRLAVVMLSRSSEVQASTPISIGTSIASIPDAPGAGAAFGRYVVLRFLGMGGMGVVYLAYDPELDRNVSLKVHRTAASIGIDSADEQLRREAMAMARLNHPNVVKVFDVGAVAGQSFVAMEFVDGRTLRQWHRERPSTHAILSACLQVGEGLAAAHAAGLVHRDVKPDNVFVARDGRVLLGDFGLARTGQDAGRVRVGTPSYMAPEQRHCGAVDARSDQFGFCAMIYEALYGQLPADAGEVNLGSVEASKSPVADDRRTRTPDRPVVATKLRRALERGLARSPEARFASLLPILEALRHATQRSRRRWLGLATVAAASAGILVGSQWATTGAPTVHCDDGSSLLTPVWSSEARLSLTRAFVSTGSANAAAAASDVTSAVDRYAARWGQAHRETCEATWVHGRQSQSVLEARMRCLRVSLGRLSALKDLLSATPEKNALELALTAVAGLPPPSWCASSDAVSSAYPPPPPEQQLLVHAATAGINVALAQDAAGRTADALVTLRFIEKTASAVHPPLQAEYTYWLGELLRGTGAYQDSATHLRAAAALAAVSHQDELMARAWVRLVAVVGYHLGKVDVAEELARVAEAAVTRSNGPGELRATLDGNLGLIYMQAGRYDQAETQFRRSLSRKRATDSLESDWTVERAKTQSNLAAALYQQGKLEPARTLYTELVKQYESHLGQNHPRTATAHEGLGIVLGDLSDPTAETHLVAALRIREAALGHNHPHVATTLLNLGSSLAERGESERAVTYFRRSLQVRRSQTTPSRSGIANVLFNLALLERDHAIGLAQLQEVLATYEATLGPEHPSIIGVMIAMGARLAHLNRKREALATLERALALAEASAASKLLLADVQFALAQVTPYRQRAVRLASEAKATYEIGRAGRKLAEVVRWLEQR